MENEQVFVREVTAGKKIETFSLLVVEAVESRRLKGFAVRDDTESWWYRPDQVVAVDMIGIVSPADSRH